MYPLIFMRHVLSKCKSPSRGPQKVERDPRTNICPWISNFVLHLAFRCWTLTYAPKKKKGKKKKGALNEPGTTLVPRIKPPSIPLWKSHHNISTSWQHQLQGNKTSTNGSEMFTNSHSTIWDREILKKAIFQNYSLRGGRLRIRQLSSERQGTVCKDI